MLLRRVPIATGALTLAVASLGNLLAPYSPVLRAACGVVASLLAVLVVARVVFDFPGVREELGNPAALAVAPAFPMALMVLATYLKPLAASAAFVLWGSALALQVGLVIAFTVRVVAARSLAHVLPSWFVVFVGYVVGAVTSPAFGMQSVGTLLLYVGIAGYLVTLPVVVYRLLKLGALPEPAVPTIAIFAAPVSLCLVGYLAVTEQKHVGVVSALLAVAVVSLLFVLSRIPRILSGAFHPGFAALTFPLVISAIAVKQSSAFLVAHGTAVPAYAAMITDALAVGVVAYVLLRYLLHIAAPAKA